MEAAQEWFRRMREASCAPDARSYGTLINGFAQLDEGSESAFRRADHWFSELEQSGHAASVIQYNQLFHAMWKVGPRGPERAKSLFQRMVAQVVIPTQITQKILCNILGRLVVSRLLKEAGFDERAIVQAGDAGRQKRLQPAPPSQASSRSRVKRLGHLGIAPGQRGHTY